MAENAGLENHRIKSFKNKGRDVEVSRHLIASVNDRNRISFTQKATVFGPRWGARPRLQLPAS